MLPGLWTPRFKAGRVSMIQLFEALITRAPLQASVPLQPQQTGHPGLQKLSQVQTKAMNTGERGWMLRTGRWLGSPLC